MMKLTMLEIEADATDLSACRGLGDAVTDALRAAFSRIGSLNNTEDNDYESEDDECSE